MQYLEHGFVRSDEMPELTEAPKNGKKHQVFNAEVATTLARFGWAPGSTFGDTMHFDFVEGYTLAVPGGRSNRSRFSPQGAAPSKQKAKP